MRPDIMSWGLPLGRVAGILVKVHWILLLHWLFELERHIEQFDEYGRRVSLAAWAAYIGLTFGGIFLHELGHCFAARRVGGDAEEVLLWPLGGLAFVDAPNHPRPQFIVAAGGPVVNLAIAIVAWPAFWWLGTWVDPYAFGSHALTAFWITGEWVLTEVNLFLLVFNLVPLYPLDGGRMLHAILWGWEERRGGFGAGPYRRATIATVWASRVTAGLGVVVGLAAFGSFFMAIICVWAWLGAEALHRSVREGAEPDSLTFGYDFSRGYTSLERSAPGAGRSGRRRRKRRPGPIARLRERFRPDRPLTAEEEARLDNLLHKIAEEGLGALSGSERRFLERVSRRKKRRS